MDRQWLLLVLVILFWAAAHVLMAGRRSLAGTRDRILTGRTDEGVPLTPEHRRLLYRTEWKPLRRALAGLIVVLCGVLIVLPELAVDPGPLRHVCRGSAVVLLVAFGVRGGARREERRLLEEALAGGRGRRAGGPLEP